MSRTLEDMRRLVDFEMEQITDRVVQDALKAIVTPCPTVESRNPLVHRCHHREAFAFHPASSECPEPAIDRAICAQMIYLRGTPF
jgi:hypothetical protein